MTVQNKTRKLVYQRDNYRCVHCGATEGLTLQHRINRQMGGSKTRDGIENLVTLCGLANHRLEVNSTFAAKGVTLGWKLRSWQNPTEVPVWYEPDGNFFFLTDRGTRIRRDQ